MTENEQDRTKPEQAGSANPEPAPGTEPRSAEPIPPGPDAAAPGGAASSAAADGAETESNGGDAPAGEPAVDPAATGPAPDPLEAARHELAEWSEKHLRLQAEFENYKRRMHKEQGEVLKYAQLPLLRDLTGVMDNLERAIAHARDSENPDHDAFVAGLELVTKQINDVFERFGMQRIQAKGQPFDPTRHEAMNLVETDTVPENTVVDELQVGYALHDRIVRPSMVSVSKPPQAAAGDGADPADEAE